VFTRLYDKFGRTRRGVSLSGNVMHALVYGPESAIDEVVRKIKEGKQIQGRQATQIAKTPAQAETSQPAGQGNRQPRRGQWCLYFGLTKEK
jgi:hypothetical protein